MDYKKLEEENNYLRAKIEYLKTYKKNYFQTKSKIKTRHCNYCDKEIKYNSFSNHEKSKKHLLKNMSDKLFIDEV